MNGCSENSMIDIQENNVMVKPSWLAKLLCQVPFYYQSAVLKLTSINIQRADITDEIIYSEIVEIEKSHRWFWDRIHLTLSSGQIIDVSGLRHDDAEKLYSNILQYRKNFHEALTLIEKKTPNVNSLYSWLKERLNGKYWVSNYDIECAISKKNEVIDLLNLPADYILRNAAINDEFAVIRDFFNSPDQFRINSNKTFVQLELVRFKDYFDTVESNPLTDSQRRAIVSNEDNTMVIAGAGSGKTSVIIAKTGYLIKKGLFNNNEILLVAFNKLAAKEMSDRIKERIKLEVRATTFHALGLRIIADVEKIMPSLSETATNERALTNLIYNHLTRMVEENEMTYKTIITYFQSFFAPYKSMFDFNELGDYYKYIKDNDLITLKGENVKSFEEIEIANFLCLNGIKYQYERQYESPTATNLHRQYKPDFYLPDYGIYIEHFAIRRDGTTPSFINQTEYLEGIKWKREIHKRHNTTLIETYSYQKREGNLLDELKRQLLEKGVKFQPISPKEVLKELIDKYRIDPLTQLCVTFLNHFKGCGYHSIEEIREQSRKRGIYNDRLEAFLSIFQHVLSYYENFLKTNNVIDFNDMINKAVDYAKNKKYLSPYKCILVDEFQDISINRARLIEALRSQAPSHRLFCVGDDWQAIYRFAGSDISIMREFSQHFGFTETVLLDRTFRFNDRIEAVATKFVLKNPAQIKKTIAALHKAKKPMVIIHRPDKKDDDIFIKVIKEINKQCNKTQHTVLCLGRYNFSGDGLSWSKAESQFPNLKLSFKTIHSAKGSEADYVIVLGMQSGKHGFPSEITDDPILDAVMTEPEEFLHAEERRLFYVALTRARHAVHLIADYISPSCFVTELKTYDGLTESLGAAGADTVYCPSCKTGELIQRTSQYGYFYSCQNYPLCKYKVPPCVKCGIGLLVYNELKHYYICNNSKCKNIERPCPKCHTGRLVERKGPYDVFLGCTNFSINNCRYTEKVKSL